MRYRALSPTGDYTFGSGQGNFLIDSPQAVAQVVLTTLKLWLGEFFLNTSDGTPYPEGVVGYHSKATADATIQNQILGVTGTVSSTNVPAGTQPGQSVALVTGISDYVSEVNPASRAYSATCTINTIYGPTQLTIDNYPNF
jgi:hypothetical protein